MVLEQREKTISVEVSDGMDKKLEIAPCDSVESTGLFSCINGHGKYPIR